MPRKKSQPKRPYSRRRPAKGGILSTKGRKSSQGVRVAKNMAEEFSIPTAETFAGLLRPLIAKQAGPAGPQDPVTLQSSPLAHLEYPAELTIKNETLALFWRKHRLPGSPEPIIASPRPRHYRTTSKRKTVKKGNTLYLVFNDRALRSQQHPFVESPLEPDEHSRIFSFLQKKISEPAFKMVADHLNYLIIRGSYSERAVIFNVDTINGPIVRKLKLLAGHLQKLPDGVTSAFIYPDPSCSEYYLEDRQPSDILQFKKLFGKSDLTVSHHGCRYFYHPTSFSQVNESMVPVMLDMALELLEPNPAETLLDLYCGYGLFSHFLAPGYKQVVGIDAEGPSIRAAISNKKSNPASRNARFLAHRISEKSVEKIPLADVPGTEPILLDPPRQGPQDRVIAALSRREPRKVLHIHCGVDRIPQSLKQWKQHGYTVQRVVPLDMFPGTAGLEVLILLVSRQL